MDGATLLLVLFVATAVIGQFLLIVLGRWLRELDDRQLAEQRARLLEDAADRQLLQSYSQAADHSCSSHKGHGHDL